MDEEQARKELQEIFLKTLKYGNKSIQWKPLNRAVMLLKKFPALAMERFMAKRNRGNKPRYPLFLLAEHAARLKSHIEPVYNLAPAVLEDEKQTYGPEKNPESLHILKFLDLEVLAFLVEQYPRFAVETNQRCRCILSFLFQRPWKPSEEGKIKSIVHKARHLLCNYAKSSIMEDAIWSTDPVSKTQAVLRYLDFPCAHLVGARDELLVPQGVLAICQLLPPLQEFSIAPLTGYQSDVFASLLTSLKDLGSRLLTIQLDCLGFLQLAPTAWDSLQSMLQSCSLQCLEKIFLDFGSEYMSGYRPWDDVGCDVALTKIAEGLARREVPIEVLVVDRATVKAPESIPLLLEGANKTVERVQLYDLSMKISSASPVESIASSWKVKPEAGGSRLDSLSFSLNESVTDRDTSDFFHALSLVLPRIPSLRKMYSLQSPYRRLKPFAGGNGLVQLLSNIPHLHHVDLERFQVDLSCLEGAFVNSSWKFLEVDMCKKDGCASLDTQICCLTTILESGRNTELTTCRILNIPRARLNPFVLSRLNKEFPKVKYFTTLNRVGRRTAGNPATTVPKLLSLIRCTKTAFWNGRKETDELGLTYGLLRENPAIWSSCR